MMERADEVRAVNRPCVASGGMGRELLYREVMRIVGGHTAVAGNVYTAFPPQSPGRAIRLLNVSENAPH